MRYNHGPSVIQREILEAEEELTVKSLAFWLEQLEKVNNIGYELISKIPPNRRYK
ncbi:MAG: hypothetical protein NC826_02640 [Candidatus Omnitrophica bacterium]|nr:hypothetical protein [Candidatus Omnitrophota bacterium]